MRPHKPRVVRRLWELEPVNRIISSPTSEATATREIDAIANWNQRLLEYYFSLAAQLVHVAILQNSKIRNLFELALAYILILATIWTSGRAQQVLLFTSATWIVVTTFLLPDKGKFNGLELLGLERSSWIVAVAAVMAAVAVAMSAQLGTLHLPPGFERHTWRAWGYIVFALVQQFILQD